METTTKQIQRFEVKQEANVLKALNKILVESDKINKEFVGVSEDEAINRKDCFVKRNLFRLSQS